MSRNRGLSILLAFCLLWSMVPLFPAAAEERSVQSQAGEWQYGFEGGQTEGWGPRGNVQVTSQTADARAGSYSLLTTGRTANWNGPSLNVKSLLVPGAKYEISGYVKPLGTPSVSSKLRFTVEEKPAGEQTGWKTVSEADAVVGEWAKLQGTYTFSGSMDSLTLYVESTSDTDSFYLDDVKIQMTTPPPGETVEISKGFEDGSAEGWASRMGVETVQATNVAAKTGSYSLLTTGRKHTYGGPKLDLTGTMVPGNRYEVSAWVKLAPGESPAKMRVSVQRDDASGSKYESIVWNTDVTENQWVQLTGTYQYSDPVQAILIYLETAEGTPAFYMDDFKLSYVPMGIEKNIPSLFAQYQDYFKIGTAIEAFQTEGAYKELIQKHFNSLVAGNAMKPSSIEPTEGQFRFADADKIVKFAKDQGISLRFHTLVWHQQAAEWMFKDKNGQPMTPNEENKKLLLKRLEDYIRAVAGRYKNDITDWDVVNEVIDPSQSDGMRRSKWYEITGTDYIETAFRVTREVVGENAKLFINDYNTHDPKKRDFLYQLVCKLKSKGVPIDGVGHQTHIRIDYPAIRQIEESIVKFAGLGLDNQITELDMSVYTNDWDRFETIPSELLIQQAHRYKELFDMFKRHAGNISNVTIWGTDDGNTWLTTFPITRLDKPLLFDDKLKAKYAYWALVDPSRVPPLK